MPMNHSHSCSRSGASDEVIAAGQPRPDFVGDREIHDDDGAAEDQMEMRRHPRGVVDHRVHAVAHVDEAAEAAEAEHDERRARSRAPSAGPRAARGSSRKRPGRRAAGRQSRSDAVMVKIVSSVGTATKAVSSVWMNFVAVAVLRVHQQMMHADRQAVDQEQDERQAPHRVAVEPSAGRARHHRVERDVGRYQPEIDDGVQRPREQRARKTDVDGFTRPSAAGMT